jgi:tetratricopeptide (TPR) repeat protein
MTGVSIRNERFLSLPRGIFRIREETFVNRLGQDQEASAMDIEQLHSAVQDAFGRRDYASCFVLVDEYLETASGEDRGKALNLKASIIRCEPRRIPEGLTLAEEAFDLLRHDPEQSLRCLATALSLCLTMGDVDKASRYEGLAHQLLQRHSNHPGVKNMQFRVQINLGGLATQRGQHPTAYWHFVQSVASLEDADIPYEEARSFLLHTYLRIADTCSLMNRWPEAAEALEKARPLIVSRSDQGRWTVHRARLLRSQRRYQEAHLALESIAGDAAAWHPYDLSRFHLERALVFQDLGDMRHFHSHLGIALQIAEESSQEFLLCEIQRAQRSPIIMEVVK